MRPRLPGIRPLWPAHRRTALVAAVVTVLVCGAVGASIAAQPARWEASVSLEVRAQSQDSLDQVADRLTLSSPAIVEAVRTRAITRRAVVASGVSTTADSLAGSVRVDIVTKPGSVSLAVTRTDPVEARRLVVALARQVIDLDLLTPQARLVVVSPVLEVVQVEPRPKVALVLALGAGTAAGLAAALVHVAATRRVRSLTDLRRLTGPLGVAAIDGRPGLAGPDDVERLARWIGTAPSIDIATVGRVSDGAVDDVVRRLGSGRGALGSVPTTVIVAGRGTPADLVRATVVTARHRERDVSAVVLR